MKPPKVSEHPDLPFNWIGLVRFSPVPFKLRRSPLGRPNEFAIESGVRSIGNRCFFELNLDLNERKLVVDHHDDDHNYIEVTNGSFHSELAETRQSSAVCVGLFALWNGLLSFSLWINQILT